MKAQGHSGRAAAKMLQGLGLSLLGVSGFAVCYRWFIVPMGLYSGGFTGIAQIIVLALTEGLGLPVPAWMDLTGIISYALNLPLLLVAYRTLGRRFFLFTVVCVPFQSLLMAFLPAPAAPLFENPMLGAVIGGMIGGYGVGLTLRAGGSGGGMDIVGMYCAKRFPSLSVGQLSIGINLLVYGFAALRSDLNVAAYSLLMSVVSGLMCDRVHDQNIRVTVVIVSRNAALGKRIGALTRRGVTSWVGRGEYAGQTEYLYMCVMNRYEYRRLRVQLHSMDPNLFMQSFSPQSVIGNFDKRLEES